MRLGVPFEEEFARKLSSGETMHLSDLPSDQIVTGMPEDCIQGIRSCIDETGCDYIIVDFGRGAHAEDFTRLRDQIELFGREVMPHFA